MSGWIIWMIEQVGLLAIKAAAQRWWYGNHLPEKDAAYDAKEREVQDANKPDLDDADLVRRLRGQSGWRYPDHN